jgi:hypothetical protein
MRRSVTAPLTRAPDGGRWGFGGFPYGLEPLVLPPVADPDALREQAAAGGGAAWRLVDAAAREPLALPGADDAATADELFWFRWITGHQVSFAVWRLMAQLLDDVALARTSAAAAYGPMSRYVHAYSAMLLYSGSCPRRVYEVLIRPTMSRWHPGFSGSWAPDYPTVREIFRGRPSALRSDAGPDVDAAELRSAVRLHALVHDGIAAKLVPDGRSLLKRAALRDLFPGGIDHGVTALLYDSFFATSRAPVVRTEVVAQLVRRLVAIANDVAANGLYPLPDEPLPVELRSVEVTACTDDLMGILSDTARIASAVDAVRAGSLHDARRGAAEVTGR